MTRSKECFKCSAVKPLEEFYKHIGMADGHLNKCKVCIKNDAFLYREKNIEKIREYDRTRAKNPDRKKTISIISAAWRNADKRRERAHNAVARAIRSGEIVQNPCVRCGNIKSIAHHEDYENKLDVVWLCQPCHKQRHKELLQGLK